MQGSASTIGLVGLWTWVDILQQWEVGNESVESFWSGLTAFFTRLASYLGGLLV